MNKKINTTQQKKNKRKSGHKIYIERDGPYGNLTPIIFPELNCLFVYVVSLSVSNLSLRMYCREGNTFSALLGKQSPCFPAPKVTYKPCPLLGLMK